MRDLTSAKKSGEKQGAIAGATNDCAPAELQEEVDYARSESSETIQSSARVRSDALKRLQQPIAIPWIYVSVPAERCDSPESAQITSRVVDPGSGTRKTRVTENTQIHLRRRHFHWEATIYYVGGGKFVRVYVEKERAKNFTARQKKSPLVRRVRVRRTR